MSLDESMIGMVVRIYDRHVVMGGELVEITSLDENDEMYNTVVVDGRRPGKTWSFRPTSIKRSMDEMMRGRRNVPIPLSSPYCGGSDG